MSLYEPKKHFPRLAVIAARHERKKQKESKERVEKAAIEERAKQVEVIKGGISSQYEVPATEPKTVNIDL